MASYVGILSWETKEAVLRNLAGLLKSPINPANVVVFDNASTDGTVDAVQKIFPDVACIRSETNLGFTGGMNRLVEALAAPNVVLLSADEFTDGRSIDRMIGTLEENPDAAVCGGAVVGLPELRVQDAGGILTYPLGVCMPHARGKTLSELPTDVREVAYVDGGFMAVNRSAFKSLGGFDENYFGYHEDVDLCWRARLMGWRVLCDSRAVAHHLTHASFKVAEQRWFLMERNRIRTNIKNLDSLHLTVSLLYELVYGPAVVMSSVVAGMPEYGRAYIRGAGSACCSIRKLWKERRSIQRHRCVSDIQIALLQERAGPLSVLRMLDQQRKRNLHD